jgi:acyl-CoA thioesterase FadM
MLLRAAFLIGSLIIEKKFATTRICPSTFDLVIKPWDCDCNGHVNNAQYLNFLDWARFRFFFEQKLWSFSFQRYFPILQNTEITYIRPIYPGERCRIITVLLYWDDKYLYFDHRFYVGAELRTQARCRAVVFNSRQERQPLLRLLNDQSPPMLESLQLWINYLSKKKTES